MYSSPSRWTGELCHIVSSAPGDARRRVDLADALDLLDQFVHALDLEAADPERDNHIAAGRNRAVLACENAGRTVENDEVVAVVLDHCVAQVTHRADRHL